MTEFLYGASGSGKTKEIMNRLQCDFQNGKHAFLIVPEQQVVISEHMLLHSMPSSAQLHIEVLSFSRLYNRVCREYGGLAFRYVTPAVKSLLMWKTLHDLSPLLAYYGNHVLRDAKAPEVMLSAVEEFKACGIMPSELEKAANRLPKDSPLSNKLRDLALIYASFDGFVSMSFDDSSDDMRKLADLLRKHDFFENMNVYIDSFTSFTAGEHAVIERIMAQADRLTITVPQEEPDKNSIYSLGILRSEKRLLRDASLHGAYQIQKLFGNQRTASPCLQHLSAHLWDFQASEYTEKSDDSLMMISCANPYEEAQACARLLRKLLIDGMRCRDIMIITRETERYRGILEPALQQNDIPFFLSDKSDLCSKPLIKFLFSALRVHTYHWRASDVIAHLKTGMYDVSARDIDLFENYLLTWNIRGKPCYEEEWVMNPDGFTETVSERGMEILRAANRLRQLLLQTLPPFFDALSSANTVKETCFATYHFMLRCGVEERLKKLSAVEAALGHTKEAEEYASLYHIALDALAEIGEAMQEEPIEISEWYKLLELAFSRTEIGTIPTAMDQVVIGSASLIRGNAPKCVIVLGLCESEFPAVPRDLSLINTPERKILSELGLELYTDTDTKTSDEYWFIQKAFSLPSQKLVLMTHRADVGGKDKKPSLPYLRTQKLFPHIQEIRFAPNQYQDFPPSFRAAQIHDGYGVVHSPIPISDTACQIEDGTIQTLFGNRIHLTQSRLERYLRCHFSYYCTYVLSLRKEQKARMREAEIGTFVHYVLENLLRTVVDENGVRADVSEEELRRMIEQVISDYLDLICPASERSSGRIRHLTRRLMTLSLLLVTNIMDEFSHSEFRPIAFEMKTDGKDGNPDPLVFVLEDGSEVSMYGVIDRVDMYRKDNTVYIRVVDYKTGAKEFSLEDVRVGLNIQMLLYLFTLCKPDAKKDVQTVPGGVVYLSSHFSDLDLSDFSSPEEIQSKLDAGISRNGLLLKDVDVLRSMNDEFSSQYLPGVKRLKNGDLSGKSLMTQEEFEALRDEIYGQVTEIAKTIKSGDANASPMIHKDFNPCQYCDMKAICRKM